MLASSGRSCYREKLIDKVKGFLFVYFFVFGGVWLVGVGWWMRFLCCLISFAWFGIFVWLGIFWGFFVFFLEVYIFLVM